jgi:hypothetical protein
MIRDYISPSTQEHNIYACGGTEEYYANLIGDVVVSELKRHGIEIYRNKPTMTLQEVVRDSNSKKPTIHFAIHSNAGGGGKARGCEVITLYRCQVLCSYSSLIFLSTIYEFYMSFHSEKYPFYYLLLSDNIYYTNCY